MFSIPTGALGAAVETIPYTYGDTNWKDKLTAYNGAAITYDAIGNPLNDGAWTYEWQAGRQMKKMVREDRTLDFKFESYDRETFQSHGTVNYTVDEDFTRITEFKYFSGQKLPRTTIVKEYSRAYTGAPGEIPYYAVINPENLALYEKYKALSETYPGLILIGRLAEYRYYNMDAITARAIEAFGK